MKRFLFEYLPAWLLLIVFGLIVLHAPMTVWASTHIPALALVFKAWKELCLLLAGTLIAIKLYQTGTWRSFIRRPVVILSLFYIFLHIFMIGLYPQGLMPTVAGLMIDLRYIAFFVVVYAFLQIYPVYGRAFVRVAIVGAAIVTGFALLQVFFPKDSLVALGYGESTIQPYLTVDKNPDFVRHNSTLRGPNPLGAYAVIVLAGVAAYGMRYGRAVKQWQIRGVHAFLAVAGLVALWISYSRSAWLGLAVALLVVAGIYYGHRAGKRTLRIGVALAVLAGLTVFALKDTVFFQNVVLHNNPTTGAMVDSNTAHVDSLVDGLARMTTQPLGAGIGSTGSASLLAGNGTIIENQYLMVAHETGWIGVIVFLMLLGAVLHQLWLRRHDWLAAAVFASGIGLMVIGLLLPVWADDTVSIVWWGLAAIVIGGLYGQGSANQKTKRTA